MNGSFYEILNDKELLEIRDKRLQRARSLFFGEAVKPVLRMRHTAMSAGVEDGVDIMENPEQWVRCVLEKLAHVAEDDVRDETTLRLLVVNCIASLFSSRFMDKIFGAEVWHNGEMWVAHELPTEVGTLEYPDIDKHPAYMALERAIREFAKSDVRLPYFMPPSFAGPLNTAINLYGARFFEAVYAEPEKMNRDLRILTDVIKDLNRRIFCLVPHGQLVYYTAHLPGQGLLAGCTTEMIAAGMYRNAFMPVEEETYAEFSAGYVMHVCGSSLQHIPNFRAMQNLKGIEVSCNKDRWEHFVRYYEGLREDQVLLLKIDDTLGRFDEALEKIERMTDGRRVIALV